jgi:hypothetical protein
MKKTNQHNPVYTRNDFEISIIGLYANISRVFEIATVGNFTMSFCYYSDKEDVERTVNPRDIKMIADYYGINPVTEGDLLVEVTRPSFDDIQASMIRNFETMEDLNARIAKAKETIEPAISTLNEVCLSLLASAYERLNISVYHVPMIFKIAQTIARMAQSETIRVEHIAEAIQYRALLDNDNVKIYSV